MTSGDYEKFFIKDGKKYHHILNPRTGSPVPATLHSVTIINKESALADGLCTALFVFGFNGAVNYLAEHPELKAVLVDEDNRTWFIPKIWKMISRLFAIPIDTELSNQKRK